MAYTNIEKGINYYFPMSLITSLLIALFSFCKKKKKKRFAIAVVPIRKKKTSMAYIVPMLLIMLPESGLNVTDTPAIKIKKTTRQAIMLNPKSILPVIICFFVKEICSLLNLLNLAQIKSKIRKITVTTNIIVMKVIVVSVGRLLDRKKPNAKIAINKKLNTMFNVWQIL